ncbi:ubiquitin, putative [Ixodes scapularis]|uniref:Ubiquitin, putative n=1 Tax=Ixodes scapularis TaxID=6945 RepID=B7P4S0_IXOSC|nr:ubiquitin, putative [Ixodes scapularis]|eukprot:XP_002406365.1 ubiquitin, putative [Ixodes scapularis]
MFISVKILQGQECTIEVSASSSISAVKQLVAQELQIPVDQQRLVFRGKTLSAAASLSLDDIERLASAGLDTTTSTTSATGGAPTRPPGRESDGAVGVLVVNSEDSAAS